MDPSLLRLSRLKNIGRKSEQWLNAIGVHTLDDLEELGAVAAYRQLKARGFPVTLNRFGSHSPPLAAYHKTRRDCVSDTPPLGAG